jgi:hypothetical protein
MGEKKQNCWEFKKCGRQQNGEKAAEFGVCPAFTHATSDGTNGGKNGGRLCWAVTGTFCEGKVQGTFAQKHLTCMNCDFFKMVRLDGKNTGDYVLAK